MVTRAKVSSVPYNLHEIDELISLEERVITYCLAQKSKNLFFWYYFM